MSAFHILFLLFLAIPLLEIYVLIKVGSLIGAIPTVFMVVFTAVLGALLLRQQGFATIKRVQASLARGEVPAIEMFEGLLLLIGGALLLTPGFVTDALGFMCLITPLRRALVLRLLKSAFIVGVQQGSRGQQRPHGDGPVTLEGEYRKHRD